jgi:parvulin-like peptidyl-prolyl isomerase
VGTGAVTQEQLDRRSKLAQLEAERFGRPVPGRAEILQKLVEEELLVQQAVRAGFLTRDQDVRSRLIQRVLAERAGVEPTSAPSEAELRAFYEEHKEELPAVERLRMRQIFLEVPPEANRAIDERVHREAERIHRIAAARPEVFPDLARKHSDDASAQRGGELGSLPMHRWVLVFGDEIAEVAPRVPEGQVGPVIRSNRGYHLFQVMERVPADADPLQAQRREILGAYRRSARERQRAALVARLRKEIPIDMSSHELRPGRGTAVE